MVVKVGRACDIMINYLKSYHLHQQNELAYFIILDKGKSEKQFFSTKTCNAVGTTIEYSIEYLYKEHL